MAYIVNNKQIRQVSVLTEPNSYQTDIRPEDMQSGSTAVSKGKIITGTGRAFEFATYGQEDLYVVYDENGKEKLGIMLPEPKDSNILFISCTSDGDIISQDIHTINLNEVSAIRVGTNYTTDSGVYVYYSDGYLCIYVDTLSNGHATLNYFEGKDNLL